MQLLDKIIYYQRLGEMSVTFAKKGLNEWKKGVQKQSKLLQQNLEGSSITRPMIVLVKIKLAWEPILLKVHLKIQMSAQHMISTTIENWTLISEGS